MIKLIASDIDGTLLHKSSDPISELMMDIVKEIIDKQIVFVAASGRQYDNLRRLFAPVVDEMGFVAENGSQIYVAGESIMQQSIAPEMVKGILEDVYSIEGCEVVLAGKNGTYIQPKSEVFRHYMEDVLQFKLNKVEDIFAVDDEILKISVRDKDGIDAAAAHFKKKWGEQLGVVTSGIMWLDMLAFGVNKGTALQKIQNKLGIKKEECIAFGDNYNDVEMFANVGASYAMEWSAEDIKSQCDYITNSVESTLIEILKTI